MQYATVKEMARIARPGVLPFGLFPIERGNIISTPKAVSSIANATLNRRTARVGLDYTRTRERESVCSVVMAHKKRKLTKSI